MRRLVVWAVNAACRPLLALIAWWDRADAKTADRYATMKRDDDAR